MNRVASASSLVIVALGTTVGDRSPAQERTESAQDARPVLARHYPADSLEVDLRPRAGWRPWPRYGEPAWVSLPAPAREAAIRAGAAVAGKPWPSLPASTFLDFARNGNRSRYQLAVFGRRRRLAELVLAECCEGKGRFLDDIVDGVWLTCEESYWGVPAHVQLQRKGSGLPDVTEPTVDLFAAETGALLAWIDYLLGARLDGISARVRERIRLEVRRRILVPCRTRSDFWWMGTKGNRLNNWTPWICSNWLTATLLLEDDAKVRAEDVGKAIVMLDRFVAQYPKDGGCDEGPGYWNRAAASLFDCLELLESAREEKTRVFETPLIREMGRFLPRMCLAGDWFVNFADAAPRVRIDAALVWRFGEAIGDRPMMSFAAAAHGRDGPMEKRLRFGSLGRGLGALFCLEQLLATEPAPGLPRDVWLPELQVMIARESAGSTAGFAIAAKGGHNAESHNHNDIGNVIVFHDGAPVLVDAGVGTYTRKTFSGRRYELWTMRSLYHNVPAPNGAEQRAGRGYFAKVAGYDATATAATLRLDLTAAYPKASAVRSLTRTITLVRTAGRAGHVRIADDLGLDRIEKPSSWAFLTPREAVRIESGFLMRSEGRKPVALLWTGPLEASVEELVLEDRKLREHWPNGLRRITFVSPKAKRTNVSFRLIGRAGG